MTEANKSGLARYEQVDGEYLQRRQLRKSARWLLLWAMGVGAVISGDFYGWNLGLTAGGFWGLALLVGLAVLYFLLHSRKYLVAQAPEEEIALIEEAKKELEAP